MPKGPEQILSGIYTENFDIIAEGFSARVNAARGEHMEEFILAGLPDSHDERFLQSDMKNLFAVEEREVYFTRPRLTAAFAGLQGMDTVIFENGFFAGGMTEIGKGVLCGSLRDAFSQLGDDLLAVYNSVADNRNDALTALNSAFMQDGAIVWVPDGIKLEEPLLIDNRFLSEETAQICFGRTLIILGEGSEANISVLYRSSGETRFLVDHVREVIVGKGGRLRFSEANIMGQGCSLLLNSYLKQVAHSRSESVFTELGQGFARFALRTDLTGTHAEAGLYGLYLASGTQHSDVELRMNHMSPDCRSHQLVKGIAAGEATGVFTGMVYVAQDAQKTDAVQQSRNLQLDDTARIYTRPQFEIYADDVKCGHGATVGQLDEEAIYYMRQRGIGESEARQMQLRGFVNDITGRCTAEAFCELVASEAGEQICGF